MFSITRENKKSLTTEARQYLTLLRKTENILRDGSVKENWTETRNFWASVYPIKAQKIFELKSIGIDATHYIRCPGKIDIRHTDRIKFGNKTLEILTIENIQEKDFVLFLVCREITKKG